MLARSSIAACAACLAACAAAAPPRPVPAAALQPPGRYPLRAPPPSLQAAASRADQAITRFKQRVTREFMMEMARRGPAAAVDALHTVDLPIAVDVLQEMGCEVGRTSERLRNPRNVPPDWAKPLLAEARPAAEVEAVVLDLGDRVGVARPIAVNSTCLECHGSATQVPPRVRAAIAAAYPADRAMGYREGDLRGFYWAEARKELVR